MDYIPVRMPPTGEGDVAEQAAAAEASEHAVPYATYLGQVGAAGCLMELLSPALAVAPEGMGEPVIRTRTLVKPLMIIFEISGITFIIVGVVRVSVWVVWGSIWVMGPNGVRKSGWGIRHTGSAMNMAFFGLPIYGVVDCVIGENGELEVVR